MQAALPVLLSAPSPSVLRIKGGTHVRAAPTYDYFEHVFLPAIRKFGAQASSKMTRAGFYPKGGGEVELAVSPSRLKGCGFLPEKHGKAGFSIISSSLPMHVAEREEKIVREALSGIAVEGKTRDMPSSCPGNAVTLWSGAMGASALGELGRKAEAVAHEACGQLLGEIEGGAAVDLHLADQLLIYAALAEGKTSLSSSTFTDHAKTNAEILRRMSARNIMLAEEGRVEVFSWRKRRTSHSLTWLA